MKVQYKESYSKKGVRVRVRGGGRLWAGLPSPRLPLNPPGGTELGLAGRGGPVLLELLLTGIWNELDRKMPSERGRGLRAVGGG